MVEMVVYFLVGRECEGTGMIEEAGSIVLPLLLDVII